MDRTNKSTDKSTDVDTLKLLLNKFDEMHNDLQNLDDRISFHMDDEDKNKEIILDKIKPPAWFELVMANWFKVSLMIGIILGVTIIIITTGNIPHFIITLLTTL